jgi:hypothetical protein
MTGRELIQSITKLEWRFVIFLSGLIIALTILPLLFGWLLTDSREVFTGTHFGSIVDWFVYYAYILQAKSGEWLFSSLFTTEATLPIFNPFWLAVGLLARGLKLSPMVAFNLARIILIPVFLFVAYVFLALIFKEIKTRKLALVILAFSSGWGALLLDRLWRFPSNFVEGQFNIPLDLWVPEANTFLSLYYSPHLVASSALILAIFLLMALFAANRDWRYGLFAGLAALALFSFHPFHVPTVFGVMGAYFAVLVWQEKKIDWRLAGFGLIVLLFSLPSVAYYFYLMKVDLVVRQKVIQNICLTTPLWITIFSYGLLIWGSLGGLWLLARKKFDSSKINYAPVVLLAVWAIVQFGLIYAPVNWQRRMTQGLHFPLAVLTSIFLFYLYGQVRQRKNIFAVWLNEQRYWLITLVFLLLFITNIFNLLLDGYIYFQKGTYAYLPKSLVAAAKFLQTRPPGQSVFNSSSGIVNFLPAYSGQKVYVGHGVETLYFFQKQKEVEWFFRQNRPESIEKDFLGRRKIDLLLYSSKEKSLGRYDPDSKSYLKLIYSNEDVKIYQVSL